MDIYLARQAIFNQYRQTVGYELLYRDAFGKPPQASDGDMATKKVMDNAVTHFGIENLTGNRRAYVNFTRNLLLDDFIRHADPEKIIVQVMESVRMDETLRNKLRALRQAGYFLVLKNYTGQPNFHPYLGLFDVIRVNFSRTNSLFQREVVRKHGQPGTLFMADRIQREADFDSARNMGYTLFQGFYLEKPENLKKSLPPLKETAYGKILSAILQISADSKWEFECADIIRHDLMLSYLFPREEKAVPPPPGRIFQNRVMWRSIPRYIVWDLTDCAIGSVCS